MDYINGQHILREDNKSLLAQATPFLNEVNQGSFSDMVNSRMLAAMDTLKPRAKTLKELAEQAKYLMLKRPIEITGKAAKPLRKEGAIAHLSSLTLRLKSLEGPQWSEEIIRMTLALAKSVSPFERRSPAAHLPRIYPGFSPFWARTRCLDG